MKKSTGFAVFSIVLLGIAGSMAYVFWDDINPWVGSPDYVVFGYEVDGIYGTNATYVDSSWTFAPIYQTSFWTTNQSDIDSGFKVDIYLREAYCVIAQSYWFYSNATVSSMSASIISNGTEVFFDEQQNSNEMSFDFSVFSTDLHIVILVYI